MKPFFTALCVLCLTVVFASAGEPELIERPLTWTIDSIQIVWNIEEKQTENYEWRLISDRSKTSSVDNSNLARDTNTTTDTSSEQFSADAEASVKGGVGFDRGFFASWGLQGSADMSTGLVWKQEDSTTNTQQNEWVKSENTTTKATESEDMSKGNQTLRYNRKLLFTVNFVNHSDQTLLMAMDSENTIPIYCGGDHLGNAHPVITIDRIFRIPATGNPYPCQFEMELNDSSKTKLLQSAPDIRILGGQIRVYNDEYEDAFTQSIQHFPHFTVRLTADGASREWDFKYNKKITYTLLDVLEAINEDFEAEDLFEFDDGMIVSVAGFLVKPTKDSEAFVLFAWNGEPVTNLQDLKPRKNGVLDVILVSRALLETFHNTPQATLIPFKEILKKWVKEGVIDGDLLGWDFIGLKPSSRDSFEWDGTKITKYIGEETEVMIPKGVTGIGNYAFSGCSSLTSVVIPDSVKEIGAGAFAGCTSLKEWSISPGHPYFKTDGTGLLTKDGKTLVACLASAKEYQIPEGVTEIGWYAFSGCSSLTSVVIPKGVTEIGWSAFNGCSSLTSVVIPEGVTEIGGNTFSGCSSLTSVVISESVTKIESFAFSGCSSLTSVVIPKGVTEIGEGAFVDCSSLTSVVIPKGVTEIGEGAFTGCTALKEWSISSSHPYFKTDGTALLTKDGKKLLACLASATEYQIPEGVTVIGIGTFGRCISLTSVVIPKGVTKIGFLAFFGCSSLTSVVIPESVTEIEKGVFSGCSSLTSVVIPKGVTVIGVLAFDSCPKLTIHAPKGSKAEEYAKENIIPFEAK